MFHAYKLFWVNYGNFHGKTNRHDFWLAYFMTILINLLLVVIVIVGVLIHIPAISVIAAIIYVNLGFLIIVPNMSMMVRRLHDSGKTGMYMFVVFIPIVGILILLVFLCSKSQLSDLTL